MPRMRHHLPPSRHPHPGLGPGQEAATVRHLSREVAPLHRQVRCQAVLDRFLVDDEVYALPVIDAAGQPVALIDRATFIEFFSRRFSRDVFGRRSIDELLAHPRYRHGAPLAVDESCTVEDAAQLIIGAGMRHMVTGFVVTRGGGYQGVANGRDLLDIITRRKQAVLYQMAHYDALTGIPNRSLFADRLERACLDADRSGRLVALLFIDVDRFKQINDSLGHSAGDEVLRQVVARLKACARQVDTVARLAGDEFVILMEGLASPDQVAPVAARIVASMQDPVSMPGQALVVTVSIGSVVYPRDDQRVGGLLAKADAAMYEAKAAGRNGFRCYSPDMPTYSTGCISLESALRGAIERDELELHYQPQVDLQGGRVLGV
ncbi:diguanylate cyclase, partial [Zoogloea sp.]|uniref:diguanylate cyclase domain-containing protein n=1 Tax=Zoogloea sp. TaxID=49181 RepID=UPI0014157286